LDYLITANQLPVVIISDISMPEEDGYSFIHKVRNLPDEKIRQIPAIALTAFASKTDEQKSLEAGFQLHHPKPFEPSLLVNEILQVISSQPSPSVELKKGEA
jgi:CheY-like chemotaxis protein